jgi:hypothetical protein
MARKKIDSRIRTLVENCVKLRQRGLFVIIGDKGRDQVVNLHYMLSKAAVKARPSVLWCYKKDLHMSRRAGWVICAASLPLDAAPPPRRPRSREGRRQRWPSVDAQPPPAAPARRPPPPLSRRRAIADAQPAASLVAGGPPWRCLSPSFLPAAGADANALSLPSPPLLLPEPRAATRRSA